MVGWNLRLAVKLGIATMGFPPAAGAQPAFLAILGKVPKRGSAGKAARR